MGRHGSNDHGLWTGPRTLTTSITTSSEHGRRLTNGALRTSLRAVADTDSEHVTVLNAASVARMVLTTETAIVEQVPPEDEHAGHHHGHGH